MTRSLRFRLLAGAAVWIVLALAMAGVVLSGLFRDHVKARFEAELGNHLAQLATLLEIGKDGRPVLTQALSDPRFRRPLSGLYWQVGSADAPLLRSRSLWDETLPLPQDEVADGEIHQHRVPGPGGRFVIVMERMITLPASAASPAADPIRIAVAADESDLLAVVDAFERVLWLSLGILAAVLIAAALVQVAVGLQPLTRLRDELATVRSGAKRRFDAAVPSEVAPLVADLNALLSHSEEVVGRARLQAGNLAHALKTNLSVLANEAETLTPETARTVGPAMARRVALMRRHIDHHMARARAAASRGLPGSGTPVLDSAAGLARTLEKLHAGRGIAVTVAVPPDLAFAGEREDLDEILGNLMDNACAWARGRVVVSARRGAARMIAVTVDDDGPGLPPDRREEMLTAGVRLDESTPGSGLGLAVVRDVARLYGGDVRLGDSPLGGLRAELILPTLD